jgi:hypothetical protein
VVVLSHGSADLLFRRADGRLDDDLAVPGEDLDPPDPGAVFDTVPVCHRQDLSFWRVKEVPVGITT